MYDNLPENFVVVDSSKDIDHPPSRYYIVNALGDKIFVKVRSRDKAQKLIDEEYGRGFYKIRMMGLAPQGTKECTARV